MAVPTIDPRRSDGRSLDVPVPGSEGGTPLLFHFGTPRAWLPFEPVVEHGPLSLAVDPVPRIVDELITVGR